MKKRKQSSGRRRRVWPAILACVTLLACGFFLAARQHFSSLDFGMKNSHLRKQIDDLESEKRRLMLVREVSLSPAELKKAALKAKVAVADAVTPELASLTGKDKPAAPTAANAAAKTTTSNPLITKTVATAATIARPITASIQKTVQKAATVDRKLVAQRSAAE
ncbi:MAG: hypothetical protein ACJ73D_06200 [Pyrinomonadaceae bacterium]